LAHLGEGYHLLHHRLGFAIDHRLEHDGLLVAGNARPAGGIAALSGLEGHGNGSSFILMPYRIHHSIRCQQEKAEYDVYFGITRRFNTYSNRPEL